MSPSQFETHSKSVVSPSHDYSTIQLSRSFEAWSNEQGFKNLQFSSRITSPSKDIDMFCSNREKNQSDGSRAQSSSHDTILSTKSHVHISLHVVCANAPEHAKSPFYVESFLKVFKGGWQSDFDMDNRRTILLEIIKLLRKRTFGASEEKILGMAKRLEEQLYRRSSSLKKYRDLQTLDSRIKRLATKICAVVSRKKRKIKKRSD